MPYNQSLTWCYSPVPKTGAFSGMGDSQVAPCIPTSAIYFLIFFLSRVIAKKQNFTDKTSSMMLSLTGIALCVHSKNK